MSNLRGVPALVGLSLTALICTACGGSPAPSGRYSMDVAGDSLVLDFKGDNKVVTSMTEDGETERMDCSYQMKGENVTVRCPGGEPMKLTFKDGSLEADMGGLTVKLNKR